MISSAPRLRRDLAVSQQQTAAGLFYVVKDPLSGEFYRFREAERFIAQQLDGATSLDVVRQRAEERFRATLPADTLNVFVKKLKKCGLLEAEATAKTGPGGRRGRIKGSLLYFRIGIFDPARLLDRMAPRVSFLFTPYFLVPSALLILLAAAATIENWSALTQDLARLRLSAVPVFMAVLFLVGSAHELAHGVTCTRYGGKVHEMGFLLIYFQPALYCDVSDAWMFPEKSKRLSVGLAGPYFELFLWALATLAWRFTDPETWINYVGLIVATSSGIKTCLNLNPFLRLDGYYLLSDYLELPNLRRTSFRYVGSAIKSRLGLGPPPAEPAEELSPRERRIYLAYGAVGALATFSLLGYVLATGGSYLIQSGQPEAALLSGGFLVMKLNRRFSRLFGRSAGASASADDDDDDGLSTTAGPDARAEPASSPTSPWRRPAMRMALAMAILAALFLCHMELRVAGPFTILPSENADVRPAVGGIIEKVYVDEGGQVRAGDVIARLSRTELVPELRKTQAEVRESRARLKLLEAGPTAEEIQVAQAAIVKAGDQLEYANSRLARSRALFEQSLLSRTELDDMQALATTAANTLEEATGRLAVLRGRSRPEDIEAAAAQVERLDEQRRYLEAQLGLITIVSPASGIVATPSRQLKDLNGQLVEKGDLIAKVYEMKTVTAQIAVSEKDIADIQVGHLVEIRARAHPDRVFQGTVSSIATTALWTSGPGQPTTPATSSPGSPTAMNRAFLVTTEIDNPSLLLKPEMTGQAKIHCGQRRLVDLLTRRVARTFKVEVWSWW